MGLFIEHPLAFIVNWLNLLPQLGHGTGLLASGCVLDAPDMLRLKVEIAESDD